MNATERESWLKERKSGIGGSDAPAVCGVSPWKSPLAVYLDKLDRLPESPPTLQMELGLLLEPAIATLYEQRTGFRLEKTEKPITRHPSIPWAFASLDYRAAIDRRPVEVKTTHERNRGQWGEPGSDEIPDHYLIQVTHEMECAEADVADVPCLFGLSEFAVFTVRRSESLARRVLEIEAEFWDRVQRQEPPEPTWGDLQTSKLLNYLNPPDGSEIDLDPEGVNLAELYRSLGKDISDKEKQRDELKARLIHLMGPASIAHLPSGDRLRRKEIKRDGYTVEPTTYVDFRFLSPPKSKGKGKQ